VCEVPLVVGEVGRVLAEEGEATPARAVGDEDGAQLTVEVLRFEQLAVARAAVELAPVSWLSTPLCRSAPMSPEKVL
jgi:hypothetical protein